jgi:hypothetical protein
MLHYYPLGESKTTLPEYLVAVNLLARQTLTTQAIRPDGVAVQIYTMWRPHGDSNPGYRRERAMS